jgi:transcriptional regulator with XRE-family HTH domain
MTQGALARKLGVSEGAVSHILNNPQNLTLKTVVAYARALGIKVSIVAYDDGDPHNERGPIDSEIFSACWENAGSPRNFWDLKEAKTATTDSVLLTQYQGAWSPGAGAISATCNYTQVIGATCNADFVVPSADVVFQDVVPVQSSAGIILNWQMGGIEHHA